MWAREIVSARTWEGDAPEGCYRVRAMDPSDSLLPGSPPIAEGNILAGKYRVDRVLGVGGMGVVVAATHLGLEQKVAIKFMLEPGLQQPALVERFAREARAAVRLKSDHAARVLDVGVLETGSPYMVMEYLDGNDLGAVLEHHGAMPIDTAVDCVLQACDAVAEAHSLGIVHRDLKPRNLFWTQRNDGRALVKVLDFGISKHKKGGDLSLTRTTEIIGSPSYMSPEQFRAARGVDERSDIWSLGVILYELITGHVPFLADTITQLTAMVLSEPPRSIQAVRAGVPDDLARAIARCLEKDPALRFPTVAHLAAALAPFAPPDARDLAARIARIGSGARGSRSGSVPFPTDRRSPTGRPSTGPRGRGLRRRRAERRSRRGRPCWWPSLPSPGLRLSCFAPTERRGRSSKWRRPTWWRPPPRRRQRH